MFQELSGVRLEKASGSRYRQAGLPRPHRLVA